MNNEREDEQGYVGSKTTLIDRIIGNRIYLGRMLLGMSQEELGGAIGISLQQVQKYETGVNRISVSRLLDVARILKVPIAFFLENAVPCRDPTIRSSVWSD